MIATELPRATRENLDLLRVVLVAQVMLGHLAAMILPQIASLGDAPSGFRTIALSFRLTTRFGPQAAVIFVVLSGFLVGGPLLQQRLAGQSANFSQFFRNRLRRLLPTLACALMITALLDVLAIGFFDAESIYRTQHYDFAAALTPSRLLGSFFCLQPTLVEVFGSNGPLWTLGYIVQFYLIGFAALFGTSRPLGALVVTALVVIATALKTEWLAFFMAWLSGATLALSPSPRRAAPFFVGGLALTILANLLPGFWSIPLASAAGLSFIVAARGGAASIKLADASAKALARFSYEIYAVHFPVGFFVYATCFRAPAASTPRFVAFLALALPAIAAAAVLTRRLATSPLPRIALAEARS